MTRLLPCAAFALLAACGAETPSGGAAPALPDPADPKLARLYAQTCKACHTTPGSGAPLAGDKAAWQPRVAQGLPTLLEHTVRGYKGMPPLGSCMDCTEKEFEALIRYMAGMDPGA